jgi:hypothetical protein
MGRKIVVMLVLPDLRLGMKLIVGGKVARTGRYFNAPRIL